jgi:hypothetical protein
VHLAHAERHVDERMEVAAAGFEQQHVGSGVPLNRLASTQPAEPPPTMM